MSGDAIHSHEEQRKMRKYGGEHAFSIGHVEFRMLFRQPVGIFQ